MQLIRSPAPLFLVTGGSGQLGRELRRVLSRQGDVIAPSRSELDLASPVSIREVIRRVKPSVIVNAGAYTAVDRAESERDVCFAVNAVAPAVLADEARDINAALVHFSTDYVFDGTKLDPYVETDQPLPLNAYGQSKLEGERAIAASEAAWVVLRTSWIYSAYGKNFLTTVLRLARERAELCIVDDQIGSPTPATAIAAATASLINRARQRTEDIGEAIRADRGVYHYASSGWTSWCGFARAILDAFPDADRRALAVRAIETQEYATPARRPANSRLDSSRILETFGLSTLPWNDELAREAAAIRAPVGTRVHSRVSSSL